MEVGSAVSEVGKWERAADIRIASRHMQQYDGVQLRPASSSLARRPQCKITAQREGRRLNVACALSSLATRLRIDDNAVRQGDCSTCLRYVNLCMKLQCVLLQLAGRLYSTPCQHTPVNASWLDIY